MRKSGKSEIGRLIGNDIKQIIRELKDIKKSIILEYAESRKELDKSIFNITITLIQHWCLVKYVTLTNEKQELKNHWKSELFNYIFRIASTKIKPDNNRDIVKKLIEKRWFEMEEFADDVDKIFAFVENKLNDEKIPINEKELLECVKEFQMSMNDIINQMTYGNKETIHEYINTI